MRIIFLVLILLSGTINPAYAQQADHTNLAALAESVQLREGEVLAYWSKSGCAEITREPYAADKKVAEMPGGELVNCTGGLVDGTDSCGIVYQMGFRIAGTRGRPLTVPTTKDCSTNFIGSMTSAEYEAKVRADPPVMLYEFTGEGRNYLIQTKAQSANRFTDTVTNLGVGLYNYPDYSISINQIIDLAASKFTSYSIHLMNSWCDKSLDLNKFQSHPLSEPIMAIAKAKCRSNAGDGPNIYSVYYQKVINDKIVDQAKYPCTIADGKWGTPEKSKTPDNCAELISQLAQQYMPEINADWDATRAAENETPARIAELRQNLAGRYIAAVATKDRQDRALVAAATDRVRAEAQNRFSNYVSSHSTKFVGKKAGTAAMVKPASAANTVALIVGGAGDESMSPDLDYDVLRSGGIGKVVTGFDIDDSKSTADQFAALQAEGMTMAYIIYLDRTFVWEGPVSVKPMQMHAVFHKEPQENPNYAMWVKQLRDARAEMAAAQGELDRTRRVASEGGYGQGTGAIGAILGGALVTAGASADYNRAVKRVAELEKILGETEKTITAVDITKFDSLMVDYRLVYDARLAIYACDLVTKFCSEKERPVSETSNASRPLVLLPRSSANIQYQEMDTLATSQLYDKVSKKRSFGLNSDMIGTFMSGTSMRIPMSVLADYIRYSDDEVEKSFRATNAPNDDAFTKVAPDIVKASAAFEKYDFIDVAGMIASSRDKTKRNDLQGL